MKRSRIFLAVSSGLLAIVSVAAAKMTHFGGTPGFLLTINQETCKPLAVSQCLRIQPVSKTCFTTLIKPGTTTQYKTIVYTTPSCVTKLHYNYE